VQTESLVILSVVALCKDRF